jgi:hypothetical protein
MAGIIFSEGSGLNDSVYGKTLAPIRRFIEKKAEAFEEKSVLDKLFAVELTTNFAEKYTGLTSMDDFKPTGEGGAYEINEMNTGYEKVVEPQVWKSKFIITREMVDDSKNIDMKKKPLAFTTSYYRTRERFGANLFASAIGGTDVTISGKTFSVKSADNQVVFSTSHPSKVKGANQSNKFSNAFTVDNLSKVEAAMQNFRDDNNNILNLAPDTIMIGNDAALKTAVFAALGADKDPNTANNGFNYQFGRWNIIINPYLNQFLSAGTSPWIVLDSGFNSEYGGAVWLDRVKLEVRTYIDENTDNNVWAGYSRFTAGFNDWRFASVGGVTGATAL